MARGKQLLQLVTMLRDETGRSNSVSVGVDDLPALKQAIRRTQETLYEEHDWPHLRTVFDRISLQAGERFYDLPSNLNYERIEAVAVWSGGQMFRIDRGIGFDEYNVSDSEGGIRSDPAQRWDIRWTGTAEQIEIWPTPASDTYELQFMGIRKLRTLVADSDVADLDDQLIVLYAAAELLPKDSSLAKLKLELGRSRFNRLKGNANRGGPRYRMGMGGVASASPRVIVNVSR